MAIDRRADGRGTAIETRGARAPSGQGRSPGGSSFGQLRRRVDRTGAGEPAGKCGQIHSPGLADYRDRSCQARHHRSDGVRSRSRSAAGSGTRGVRQVRAWSEGIRGTRRGLGTGDLQGDRGGARRRNFSRQSPGRRSAIHLHPAADTATGNGTAGDGTHGTMNSNKATVLIIEDEAAIRHFLRVSLGAENLKVVEAEDGASGLAAAHRYRPDIYILDLGLPDRDGMEIIRELRGWTRNPIIVVTARTQEDEKVRALDMGADDYLTKPFGVQELKARIRSALRHLAQPQTPSASTLVRLGEVQIDLEARRVSRGDEEVRLTPTEFKLLALLAKSPGRVLTQRALLVEVWGAAYESESHYMRVYLNHMRQKLEPDPSMPKYLMTETGVGYRLVAD